MVGVPVLYVLSFGPACWMSDRNVLPFGLADAIYRPLLSLAIETNCDRALEWYGTLVELPELPAEVRDATDCRLYNAVEIRVNAESDAYRRKH